MSASAEQAAAQPASTNTASAQASAQAPDIELISPPPTVWCRHTCGCGHRSGNRRREITTHTGTLGYQAGVNSQKNCRAHEHTTAHASCGPGCEFYDNDHPRDNREGKNDSKKREREAKVQAIGRMAQEDCSKVKRARTIAMDEPVFPGDGNDTDTSSAGISSPEMAIAALAAMATSPGRSRPYAGPSSSSSSSAGNIPLAPSSPPGSNNWNPHPPAADPNNPPDMMIRPHATPARVTPGMLTESLLNRLDPLPPNASPPPTAAAAGPNPPAQAPPVINSGPSSAASPAGPDLPRLPPPLRFTALFPGDPAPAHAPRIAWHPPLPVLHHGHHGHHRQDHFNRRQMMAQVQPPPTLQQIVGPQQQQQLLPQVQQQVQQVQQALQQLPPQLQQMIRVQTQPSSPQPAPTTCTDIYQYAKFVHSLAAAGDREAATAFRDFVVLQVRRVNRIMMEEEAARKRNTGR